MNLHDCTLYSKPVTSSCENKRLLEIWLLASALCVHAHQAQLVPDLVHQDVDAKLHLHRDTSILWVRRQSVDILNRNGVDLVVDIDALTILSITFD